MEKIIKWKILRVLTTNACNYECIYCHNEGQDHDSIPTQISLQQFIRFFSITLKAGIKEVRFSGGEPLTNRETIDMIEWVNANAGSDIEIGLATNGSLITDAIAKRLGSTRVMVTLHFPGVGKDDYFNVTKRNWQSFETCINLFDKHAVDYSFNYTLYPNTITAVDKVIEFSIQKGKRVKLLPYLDKRFNNLSEPFMKRIIDKLNSINGTVQYFEKERFHLWTYNNGGAVKIIDSPCYTKDVSLCKEYGEIRLLPDLSLMNCIFGKSVSTKNLSDEEIVALFHILIKNMSTCKNVISI